VLRREDQLPHAEVEGEVAGLVAVSKGHVRVGRAVDVDVVTAAAHLDLHAVNRHVLLARKLEVGALGELGAALDRDRADGDLAALLRVMHVGTIEGLGVGRRRGENAREQQEYGRRIHPGHRRAIKPRIVPAVKPKMPKIRYLIRYLFMSRPRGGARAWQLCKARRMAVARPPGQRPAAGKIP